MLARYTDLLDYASAPPAAGGVNDGGSGGGGGGVAAVTQNVAEKGIDRCSPAVRCKGGEGGGAGVFVCLFCDVGWGLVGGWASVVAR